MKTVSTELIKARIDELQSDVDRVKVELQSLKESVKGNFTSEDVEKVDMLTRELITYKAGQAELFGLIEG